jgi:hypothetical protein
VEALDAALATLHEYVSMLPGWMSDGQDQIDQVCVRGIFLYWNLSIWDYPSPGLYAKTQIHSSCFCCIVAQGEGYQTSVLFACYAGIVVLIIVYIILEVCHLKTGLKLIMPITWIIVLVLTILCTVELYIVMITCDFCMDPAAALLSELDSDRYDSRTIRKPHPHTPRSNHHLNLFHFRFPPPSLISTIALFSSFCMFSFVAPFTPRYRILSLAMLTARRARAAQLLYPPT